MDSKKRFGLTVLKRLFAVRPTNDSYRYEDIPLFPEDLNASFHPADFAEKVVDPKSFRNILTSTLGWTVGFVLALFLIVQITYIKETTRLWDNRQMSLAGVTASLIEMRYKTLKTAVEDVFADFPFASAQSDDWLRALYRLDHFAPIRTLRWIPANHQARAVDNPSTWFEKEDFVVLSIPVRGGELQLEMSDRNWIASDWTKIKEFGLQGTLFDEKGNALSSSQAGVSFLPLSLDKVHHLAAQKALWTSPETRNHAVIHAYVAVPGTSWILAVDQTVMARDKEMRSVVFASGFLFIAAVFGVFIIGFIASRPLSLSVGHLAEMFESFMHSGKTPPVPKQLEEKGPTELLEIARHFAKVAGTVVQGQETLRELNSNLEKEVDKRTQKLSQRNAELSVLQKLLAPLNQSAGKSVQETLQQVRQILGLQELIFVPKTPDLDLPLEILRKRLLPVLAEKRLLGWLATSKTDLDMEALRGLKLLASSLGVLLFNHQLLQSIANQHRTLEAVFASMTEGVALLDREGRLLQHNDCLSGILGFEIPAACSDFMAMVSPQFAIHWISNGKGSNSDVTGESTPHQFLPNRIYQLVNRDSPEGQSRTLLAITFGIRIEDRNAQQPSLGIVIRDISEDVQIEKIKDRLISVVAHELKTPITALRLQAETLATQIGLPDEERASILQDMQDEAFRLRNLVDDWLDISRLQEGKVQLQKRIVHIATPIDKAAKIVRARYCVEVHRSIDPEAECFPFDPERMTQVFINLLNNAARYCRDGILPRVDITITKQGKYVEIIVKDNGIGIPKNKQAYVFERFYQADMSIARRRGGTGLGLAIVKGIVEAHGGSISLQSEVGKGTTFRIALPY